MMKFAVITDCASASVMRANTWAGVGSRSPVQPRAGANAEDLAREDSDIRHPASASFS